MKSRSRNTSRRRRKRRKRRKSRSKNRSRSRQEKRKRRRRSRNTSRRRSRKKRRNRNRNRSRNRRLISVWRGIHKERTRKMIRLGEKWQKKMENENDRKVTGEGKEKEWLKKIWEKTEVDGKKWL